MQPKAMWSEQGCLLKTKFYQNQSKVVCLSELSLILLVLYDSKCSDKDKFIIGLIKIDMNTNLEIIYLCQNFNMIIKFFVKHIKIIIQTKKYDNSKIVIYN